MIPTGFAFEDPELVDAIDKYQRAAAERATRLADQIDRSLIELPRRGLVMVNPNTKEPTEFPFPDHLNPILEGPYKNAARRAKLTVPSLLLAKKQFQQSKLSTPTKMQIGEETRMFLIAQQRPQDAPYPPLPGAAMRFLGFDVTVDESLAPGTVRLLDDMGQAEIVELTL